MLFAIFVFTIIFTVFGAIKSTDAYKTALARAKADPRVTEAIGTPIKDSWYVVGKSEVSGGSGTAELAIPISGPKGKATIYCSSSKDTGQWKFNKLNVKIEATSQIIDLSDRKPKANEEQENDAEEKDDDAGGE